MFLFSKTLSAEFEDAVSAKPYSRKTHRTTFLMGPTIFAGSRNEHALDVRKKLFLSIRTYIQMTWASLSMHGPQFIWISEGVS